MVGECMWKACEMMDIGWMAKSIFPCAFQLWGTRFLYSREVARVPLLMQTAVIILSFLMFNFLNRIPGSN